MTEKTEQQLMDLYRRARVLGSHATDMFLAYTFGLMMHHVDERDLAILTTYMDRQEAASK